MIYEDMLQPPAILRFDAKTGASMVQTLPAAPVDSRDFLIRHDHATAHPHDSAKLARHLDAP